MDEALFNLKYPTLYTTIAINDLVKKKESLMDNIEKEMSQLKKAKKTLDSTKSKVIIAKITDLKKQKDLSIKEIDSKCLLLVKHVNKVMDEEEATKRAFLKKKSNTLIRYPVKVADR